MTPGRLTCPTCLVEHSLPGGISDLQKLVKNFTLLSLIEAAKGANALTPKMAVPKRLTPKGDQQHRSLEEEIKSEEDNDSTRASLPTMPPPSLPYN